MENNLSKKSRHAKQLLKRSCSHATNEITTEKPVLRKTSSVGHNIITKIGKFTSTKNIDDDTINKALDSLKNDSLHLSEKECVDLHSTLNRYQETEEERKATFIKEQKEIFDASIRAYEAHKEIEDCMINFHAHPTDEKLLFCYMQNCDESDASLHYTKSLILTQHCNHYAGFERCAIFRIVRFCPDCHKKHTTRQMKQPHDPLLVMINQRAFKLFSSLTIQ